MSPFVLPIYPEDFSVHNLLRQSRRVPPVEVTDGSAVVTGVDAGLLIYALGRLDRERTRHRRILVNWMFYRAQSLLDPSRAISLGNMLMLFTQHPSGAMCDGDTSRSVVHVSSVGRYTLTTSIMLAYRVSWKERSRTRSSYAWSSMSAFCPPSVRSCFAGGFLLSAGHEESGARRPQFSSCVLSLKGPTKPGGGACAA